ncbi:MAG: hypothetical protein E6Q40_03200 [Cupriavidus sp.]|nr:MAG: hypothetical protein E6Q40_03200 [Cupriavidus sp.]
MTTPDERFRALVQFPRMLAAAIADEQLPTALRAQAQALHACFPDEALWHGLSASRTQGLTPDIASTLEAAAEWVVKIQVGPKRSAELTRWCEWAERRFPSRDEVQVQRQAARERTSTLWPSIDDWIQPPAVR